MFLSKRSNGIYYVFYENENGKKTCKSTQTKIKKEAYRFLSEFSDEFKKRKEITDSTLNDFAFEFLKYSELNHSRKTMLTYKTTFNAFIKFCGNRTLSSLKELDIHDFLQYRRSNSSIYAARKDQINLKASFNWAIMMNYLDTNPAANIKRIKTPEKQPTFFTKDELHTLLETIDDSQMKSIVRLAVYTGMRQMEIISLRWDQVDFDKRLIILNNQNHTTKSKRVRTIPLNEASVSILKAIPKLDRCNNVFTYNGEQMKQDYLVKRFRRYILASNINPNLNFHSLRHTFASWLVQRGVPIYNVSKLLGHSNIRTTEIYAHLRSEDLRDSVDLL